MVQKLSWICSQKWGNCELQRTDNVCGCNYWSMRSAKWRLLCLLFFKHLFQCVEQNVYKLLLVWNESWLLRATFCMNKKWKKRKTNWKPAITRDQSRALSLERRTAIHCAKFAECNCCWEFSLGKQTLWIKWNFFLLKVSKYKVSSGDSTTQPVWVFFYFQWLRTTLILVTDIVASLL